MDNDDDPGLMWLGRAFDDAMAEMKRSRWVEAVLAKALDGQVEAAVRAAADTDAVDHYRPPEGSFDYITISITAFLRALHELDRLLAADPDYAAHGARYRPVRFLEIGCGPGRNLQLLRHGSPILWAELVGIDIAAPLVEAGRRAFGDGEVDLRVADATTYDLAPYDVIFSYRPFMDDDMQLAFEAYVERSMSVGAYLLAPLAMNRRASHRMLEVGESGDLWKKIA